MEIKDPGKPKVNSKNFEQASAPGLKPAGNTLAAATKVGTQTVTDKVDVNVPAPRNNSSDFRQQANQVINGLNMVADATSEISKLVRSIEGIVDLVGKGDLPERRVQALEREANDLSSKIQELTSSSNFNTPKAGQDQEIRRKVEEQLGRALDSIFPEDPAKEFGVGKISFSKKEIIISTATRVAEVRERIENLSSDVSKTQTVVESVVNSLDVALQNSASAETSIRDVDQAVKLASETRLTIFGNPEDALRSVGNLNKSALGLLE